MERRALDERLRAAVAECAKLAVRVQQQRLRLAQRSRPFVAHALDDAAMQVRQLSATMARRRRPAAAAGASSRRGGGASASREEVAW